MKRKYFWIAVFLLALVTLFASPSSQLAHAIGDVKNYWLAPIAKDNVLVIGGTQNVVSGGVENVKSGGSLLVKDGATFKIGTAGQNIPSSFESTLLPGPPFGTWSAIGANASTSATFTVTGAAVNDICIASLPTSISFHLNANCVFTAANTGKLFIHGDGTGATPPAGQYILRSLGHH